MSGERGMLWANRTGTAVSRNRTVTDFSARRLWNMPRCWALVGGSRRSGTTEPAATATIPGRTCSVEVA